MLIGRDADGRIVSWTETYFTNDEIVTVNATRNITTISTQNRKTGAVASKTFFGTMPLPGAFDPKSE